MKPEGFFKASKHQIERHTKYAYALYTPPGHPQMAEAEESDQAIFAGNVPQYCIACNHLLTKADVDASDVMFISDAFEMAHIACLLQEGGIDTFHDDKACHYILGEPSAEIAYYYLPNMIIGLHGNVCIVRCENEARAKYQLGRLQSGRVAGGPDVYMTRADAYKGAAKMTILTGGEL